ncbi:MAG: MFS transporter [Bacteroidota bacterium]|nr:MFS transporter [Bacteroidota bacterium]
MNTPAQSSKSIPESKQNSTKTRFQSGNVIIIGLSHLLHDIYSSFLAPILPLLIEKLGISLTAAGLLGIIQRIPSLFNPFVGIMAENMKVRYFVIFAPALTTISMSLIGLAPGYVILAIFLFVAGFSSTLYHVPSPVMIKRVSGDKLGKGMSYFMVGGELARTLGPLIIVAAVTHWGLEGTYKLIPFGILASIILFFRLRKIDLREEFTKSNEKPEYYKTFKKFLPTFAILGFIIFFRGAMKSALTLYLAVYLTEIKGNTLWFAATALSVLQLAGVLGTFSSGTISDRIGRRTTMVIITTITPVLMWLFLNAQGVLTFPVLIITGFFLVAPGPVMLAIIQELKTKHLAFVNGIYMTITFGFNSLMLLLVGVFSDHFGMETTYIISGIAAGLSIPFAFMLPRKRKQG